MKHDLHLLTVCCALWFSVLIDVQAGELPEYVLYRVASTSMLPNNGGLVPEMVEAGPQGGHVGANVFFRPDCSEFVSWSWSFDRGMESLTAGDVFHVTLTSEVNGDCVSNRNPFAIVGGDGSFLSPNTSATISATERQVLKGMTPVERPQRVHAKAGANLISGHHTETIRVERGNSYPPRLWFKIQFHHASGRPGQIIDWEVVYLYRRADTMSETDERTIQLDAPPSGRDDKEPPTSSEAELDARFHRLLAEFAAKGLPAENFAIFYEAMLRRARSVRPVQEPSDDLDPWLLAIGWRDLSADDPAGLGAWRSQLIASLQRFMVELLQTGDPGLILERLTARMDAFRQFDEAAQLEAAALIDSIKAYQQATKSMRESPPVVGDGFDTDPQANLGNPVSGASDAVIRAYQEGVAYWTGDRVEQDYVQASNRLRFAAENGHVEAQGWYGYMLMKGLGLAPDPQQGLAWMTRAAEAGSGEAANNLGLAYHEGWGIPVDNATACSWWRKAAAQDHPWGLFNVGECYANGWDTEVDHAQAAQWYRKAADHDLPAAVDSLGWLYQQGMGVPQDIAMAVRLYRQAAEAGHANGQNNLGWMYHIGLGVEQDDVEAVRWLRLAAENGSTRAQVNLRLAADEGWLDPDEMEVPEEEVDELAGLW